MNAPQKPPVDTVKQWVRFASGDLGVAERELTYDVPAYHTICFLCQSAAEKFLKGFLIYHGWQLKKTHDIVALLALCSEFDGTLAAMAPEGSLLNEYIVAGRYPEDLAYEQLGEVEAQEALQAAQKIRDRVLALLNDL